MSKQNNFRYATKFRHYLILSVFVCLIMCSISSEARAGNCWKIIGWLDPTNQPSTGQISDHADLVTQACTAPAPVGYAWFHPSQPNSQYTGNVPTDLYALISLSDPHASGGLFAPLLLYNGATSGVPILIVNMTTCTWCSNTMPFFAQPGSCTRQVTWWNGPFQATFDGVNCYVAPVPSGHTAFLYQNSYYVTAVPSNVCQVGSYDGKNCYVGPLPNGGFIYNNSFYAPAGTGHSCSVGTYDGANCYISTVPPGSQAFIFGNGFYASSLMCAVGRYDGANCYLGTPPSTPTTTTAFIFGGNFYYHE